MKKLSNQLSNTILKSLAFAVVAFVISACTPKNSDNQNVQNGNVAAVSIPNECLGPQTGQALPYSNDVRNANFSSYDWDQRGQFRRGGCPRGTFAACGSGIGMICVPANVMQNSQVAWYNYVQGTNQSPRQMSFCGYEGFANRGSCAYRSMLGAGMIGRACHVRDPNSCGGFGVCQRVGRGHRVGVCVNTI